MSLNEAVRKDSAAMRTIAVVTLAFLPSTFISVRVELVIFDHLLIIGQTIFSTSFFNFSPGPKAQQGGWFVSDKIWIYWVIAIPLTIMTLSIWLWGQHKARLQHTVSRRLSRGWRTSKDG